jgi:low affinity Fe/Cu permease
MKSRKDSPSNGKVKITFRRLAERTSHVMGSSIAFFIALTLIIFWGISGSYFEFSDTWQLIINTATTIGTFLIVILIQNTQNRESRSIQLKLDELVRGTKNTRNSLMEIEELSDEELDELKLEFKRSREKYMTKLEKRRNKNKRDIR